MSLVDDKQRGIFSANKEIISLISGIVFTFIMGRIIDYYKGTGEIRTAFLICAVCIFVVGTASLLTMIFTVETEGERTIFLGDATDQAAEIAVNAYGDYLKSDILQLSHHGKRNYSGMKMSHMQELYTFVRPEIVLWPTSNDNYLTDGDETEVVSKHFWNLEALKSARECYIAGGSITVLELPYSIYSAYKFDPTVTRDPVRADAPSTEDSLKYLPSCNDTVIDQVEW
jgi:hypothetical protein